MIEKKEVYLSCFHMMRTLHIYLPADYDRSRKRYPVLYMYDGHNLFYDEDATFGTCWGLRQFLERQKHDIIVIGIECNHEGNNRLAEFSPYSFQDKEVGRIEGLGAILMDWVVKELKPWVDHTYRTKKGRKDTSIMGSSMGGLMALYTILHHNKTFSKAGCLSCFLTPLMADIIHELEESSLATDTRVFISWGSDEFRSKSSLAYGSERNLSIANELRRHGAIVYPYLHLKGKHNEASWRKELPILFPFLYDKDPSNG